MAELGRVILNGQHQVTVDADPSVDPVDAPLGSIALLSPGLTTFYTKTGSNNSDWLLGGAGGIAGPQGDTGIAGPTGFKGPTGPQGLGETGLRGETGLQGTLGETGPQGPTGAFGGPQGETGVQGILGETGVQGIQGIQGITGVQGETGIATSLILDVYNDDHSHAAAISASVAFALIDGSLSFANINTTSNTGVDPSVNFEHAHNITVTYDSANARFDYIVGSNHSAPFDHIVRQSPKDGATGPQGETGA